MLCIATLVQPEPCPRLFCPASSPELAGPLSFSALDRLIPGRNLGSFSLPCGSGLLDNLSAHASEEAFVLVHHRFPVVVGTNPQLRPLAIGLHERTIAQDAL